MKHPDLYALEKEGFKTRRHSDGSEKKEGKESKHRARFSPLPPPFFLKTSPSPPLFLPSAHSLPAKTTPLFRWITQPPRRVSHQLHPREHPLVPLRNPLLPRFLPDPARGTTSTSTRRTPCSSTIDAAASSSPYAGQPCRSACLLQPSFLLSFLTFPIRSRVI